MSLIPGLGNKYLAYALAAGLSSLSLALGSLLVSPDPQPRDYAMLGAEVLVGFAIAIIVYGISRKNDNKLREIAAEARKLSQMQVDARRHLELAAERRLKTVLHEIDKAADEVMESKRAYDAGVGAKQHRVKEVEAKCGDLANAAREITGHSHSVYWMERIDELTEIYGICEKGPVYADGHLNVSFCAVVKAKVAEQIEGLQDRLETGASLDAPNARGSKTGLLSVSLDRAVYPPQSTIRVEVKANRRLTGRRIRCKIRDRGGNVLADRNLGPDASPDPDLGRGRTFEAQFKAKSSWAAGAYAIRARCGASSAERAFSIAKSALSVESDKEAYVVGSDMTITVTDPDAGRDGNAAQYAGDRAGSKLVVESRHGRLDGHRLQETGPATGKFSGTIRIAARKGGPAAGARGLPVRGLGVFARFGRASWMREGQAAHLECGRGEEITIRYTNSTGTAARTVRTHDSGAAVDLDRETYTCTDRVLITVTAPGFEGLPASGAPGKRCCAVSIKTSIGRLAGYKLAEREPHSGIFAGSVLLTGFPDMAQKIPRIPFGATRGRGPNDGLLACTRDDEVEVIVEAGGKLYRKAAPTRWNQGYVEFLAPSYAIGDSAALRVTDPDMNLDPDAKDSFNVRVTSDSDREGIEVAVTETDITSGVFYGAVALDYKRSSQQDAALLVSNGDTIRAEYIDVTPPSPSAPLEQNWFYSGAIISADRTVPPPLERLKISSISASSKTGPGPLAANAPASVRVAVGGAKDPYAFTVILQIKDSDGAGPAPLWHPAFIDPRQTFECEFRWTPPRSGEFLLTAYLWRSMENPTAFCPPKEIRVRVV